MRERGLIAALCQKLGRYRVESNGREYIFTCPYCKHWKLYISPNKCLFHCFFCKVAGHLKSLLFDLKIEGLIGESRGYVTSYLEQGMGRAKLEVIRRKEIIPPCFIPISGIKLNLFTMYLRSRNISPERIDEMKVGYTSEMGPLYGRIIIPIMENGYCVFYVGRSVTGDYLKELSAPACVSTKSDFLYNYDAIEPNRPIYIVEGIFDCEAMIRAGKSNTVAILGSHLSQVQIGKLLTKAPTIINLMLDGDQAGKQGAQIALQHLQERFSGKMFIKELPEGYDPDSLPEDTLRLLTNYFGQEHS